MTRATAMLAAALCACVLLVLPATALAGNGTCVPAFPGVAAGTMAHELHADLDVADRPELGGVSVKQATRKPRRSNRRLRHRGRDRLQSACARAAIRTSSKTAYMDPKRKRHRGKRSLMRLLMTVRGGLQA
jgi:hypothetical protein